MADVEIILSDADGNNQVNLGHGTGVKESRDTSTSTTVCFDEVLNQGTKNTSWSIEVNRVDYEGMATAIEVEEVLEKMLDTEGIITIRETIRPKGEEPYVKIRNYNNTIVDGEDYEVKPEDFTVQNLKFKTGIRDKPKRIPLSQYTGD